MNVEVREAVTKWMNSVGVTNPAEMPLKDYQDVRRLLGSDRTAFGIFLSLIMFERQQAVLALINADVSSSSGAVKAAKLQGIVQCVDNVRDLILNIADPIGEGSDPNQEQGVFSNGRTEQQPVT